jgi:Holliday junction resolvasome RuvABC ATP-dependent DNA helicase subunit
MTVKVQHRELFFDPTADRRMPMLPGPPTDEEVREVLDSAFCPLNNIVVGKKNEKNLHKLRLFAFTAYKRSDHSCRGMNFGIYAGPGQGKTHVVKAFANTIGIPFVFVQSDALKSTWQLFQLVAKAFEDTHPLVPQEDEYSFTVPPCIVFFDEAHALSKDLRTGGLLNAMEYNDGWLRTTQGGTKTEMYTIDCQNVCWIAATTDPGVLFKESQAFYDRLDNHLIWAPAGRREIEYIIRDKYPKFPDEACEQVAFFNRVPRLAVAFAKSLVMERDYSDCSWEEAAAKVAEMNGIDKFGMSNKLTDILKALGQRPISKSNLLVVSRVRSEELEKMILPPLMEESEDRPPLVQVTSKGYAITRAGLGELDKRGITHRGDKISAEMVG